MLRTLGHNLHGFLMNLDSLHDHLSVTYPEMQAPSFRCEKSGRTLLLHYYSLREGLHPIVTGIVKAVAQHYFKLDVEIKMEKYEQTQEQLCHYYLFRINVKGSKKDDLERMFILIVSHLLLASLIPKLSSKAGWWPWNEPATFHMYSTPSPFPLLSPSLLSPSPSFAPLPPSPSSAPSFDSSHFSPLLCLLLPPSPPPLLLSTL